MRAFALAATFLVGFTACQKGLTSIDENDEKQKLGYTIGYSISSDMRKQELAIDSEAYILGFRDGMGAVESKLSQETMLGVMQAFQKEMMAKRMEQAQNRAHGGAQGAPVDKAAVEKNAQVAAAWLADNAKKSGVKTTASGLQYEVLKPGSGKKPSASSQVTVHYEGKLVDGTVFDSSVQRGEPVKFPLDGVIPGWTEGLQLMQEGGKNRLYIPPQLAYGEGGAGERIPPNAALIFEVELIKVE